MFNENFDITSDQKVSAYTRREHQIRYELVLPYVKDKTVLDIGCGYGYGSAMLAKEAKRVTAIDLNTQSISTATVRHRHISNLEFVQGDALSLLKRREPDVDIVVLYEVLEHVEAHDELLRYIWSSMKKDGRLFLSTPNRLRTPFYRKNPYHLRELSLEELTKLMEKWFVVDLFKGQILGLWAVLPQSFVAPMASKLNIHERIACLNDDPASSMTAILSGIRRELP